MFVIFEVVRLRGVLLSVQFLINKIEVVRPHVIVVEAVGQRGHEDLLETKGETSRLDPCIYPEKERFSSF